MKLLAFFIVSVGVFAAGENEVLEKKTVKRGILGGYGYGGYGYGHGYPVISYSPVVTKVYGHYGGYGNGYYGGLGHGFYGGYYPYYSSYGLGHGLYSGYYGGYHGW